MGVAGEPKRSATDVTLKVAALLGVLLIVVLLGLPFWASLAYRSAVRSLHEELAEIELASARVAAASIHTCWDDSGAPASIRVLRPRDGYEVQDVEAEYRERLAAMGFDGRGDTTISRERDDELDGDLVRLTSDEGLKTVTVISDAFDTDMVVCLPF